MMLLIDIYFSHILIYFVLHYYECSISAGELSSQNKVKLDKIFVSISDMAQKAQSLESDVKSSLQKHTVALDELHGDYTPIAMTRALQVGLKECGGR
jgi:hypothetical protein